LYGLKLLDTEWEHINFAQSWIRENDTGSDRLELCNEYPNAGYMILSLRLHPKEYIFWLNTGLEAARKLENKQYKGYHLGNLGLAYADLGDAKKAIEFYEQQLVIVREIGDRRGEAFGSWNLGQAYEKEGDLEKAVQYMQVCVDFEREIGHPDAEKDAAAVDEIRKRLK